MLITLCGPRGSGKYTTAEALKKYFGYRGMPCYCYDYWTPLNHMYDALAMAMQSYDLTLPRTWRNYKDRDTTLQDAIYRLIPVSDWQRIVKEEITKVTQRWEELKVHYVIVLYGVPTPDELHRFNDAFRVWLNIPATELSQRVEVILEENSHIINQGFHDCAVSDIFDLVVDTSKSTPDEVASQIGTTFQEKISSVFKRPSS